jgi:hypothetical protein
MDGMPERPSVEEYRDRLVCAIEKGDSASLESIANELDFYYLGQDIFSEDVFKIVLDILVSPEFAKMKGGWVLLTVFRDNRRALTKQQEQCLLDALQMIFSKFDDWMSWFFICELLGRDIANRRALDTLSMLAKIDADLPRSFVPHGLEHIIISGNNEVANAATSLLFGMRDDHSDLVRQRVAESLNQLDKL